MHRFSKGWILRTLCLCTAFLSTSTGSALAADEGWQFLNGPQGASVRELARAPSDPDVLYAATSGDLYKSIDDGATWQALGLATPIVSVAVHPQNSSIVLAGTDFGELAKTVDGGATWVVQQPPFILALDPVLEIAFNPSSPATAYALVRLGGFSRSNPPVVKTVDTGATWIPASDGLLINEDPPIYGVGTALTLDPQNPSTLYTLDEFGNLSKSVDQAVTWTPVPNTGLNTARASFLAVDPADSSFLFTGLFFGGFYRSDDGGLKWLSRNAGLSPVTRGLAFGPGDPPVLFGATIHGMFRSDDRAESWFSINSGIEERGLRTVLVDPSDSQHLHAAGEVGVFETTDGGTTWAMRNQGIFHRTVHILLTDRSSPSTVLAATRTDALHRSTDQGQSWPLVRIEGLIEPITSLAAAPSDPSRVYLGSFAGKVYRSSDHGQTWTLMTPAGGSNQIVTALAVHPTNPQIVYAGVTHIQGWGLVMRSTDGGQSWTAADVGLLGEVVNLAIDPQNPSILYAGEKLDVAKSTDGGVTWAALLGLGQNFTARYQVFLDPRQPSTVYAVIERHGIFRSMDGGVSWGAIQEGLPSLEINTLLVDPDEPSILYAAPKDAGVYRSLDRGESWAPFNLGFPDAGSPRIDVATLAIASTAPERKLYAGVFTPDVPSGVYARSVPFPSLFTDGFESGDISSWSQASSP